MATADSVKGKIQELIYGANEVTGWNDATLIEAVNRLCDGYMQGEPVLEGLEVAENGSYMPREGVDGFSSVSVNVDATAEYEAGYSAGWAEGHDTGYEDGRNSVTLEELLPDFGDSATNDDVRYGKEYIGSDGVLNVGTMPENSDADIVIEQSGSAQDFAVHVRDGYYPYAIDIQGIAGGNLSLVADQNIYSVGSKIFNGTANLKLCMINWTILVNELTGSKIGYMPATIMLSLDGVDTLIAINGAFLTKLPISITGNLTLSFAGSDATNSYQFQMTVDATNSQNQSIKSMSLTQDGMDIDIPDGLSMGIAIYVPV